MKSSLGTFNQEQSFRKDKAGFARQSKQRTKQSVLPTLPSVFGLPEAEAAVAPNAPLRLATAAKLAFPDGSMTASGLRKEAFRGKLITERIANKDYTTLEAINRMRELCRVQAKGLTSDAAPLVTRRQALPRSVWVIRDGKFELSTGCLADPSQLKPPAEAQQALADYISRQHNPRNTSDDIKEIDIADVLLVYLNDKVGPDKLDEEMTSKERHLEQAIGRINELFGGRMLSEINTQLCKSYVRHRISEGGGEGGARRDLEMLRAAINFHSGESALWQGERLAARQG